MEIFIVLYSVEGYHTEIKHMSFEDFGHAKDFAVEKANDNTSKLKTVLGLDTDYRKTTEYELQLIKGNFSLEKIRKEDN